MKTLFCPACGADQSRDESEIPDDGFIKCEQCKFRFQVGKPKRKVTKPEPAQAPSMADAPKTEQLPQAEQPEAATAKTQQTPQAPSMEPVKAATTPPRIDATDPDPKTAPKPKPKPKAKAPKAKAPMGRPKIPWPGCGRSGARFRFRDLFVALQAPLDMRKTFASAAGVFAGLILLSLMSWLGTLTKSNVGATIGAILGGLLFWACTFLGVGLATRLTDLEMRSGKRASFAEGLDCVKAKMATVLGTPFLFLAGIVGLGAGMAVLALLARIPYAGPILYGLTFFVTLLLAFGAVFLSLMMVLTTFSYIPAMGDEDCGPVLAAKRVWGLFSARAGWYLLHWLLALVVTGLLLYLFGQLFDKAFFFIEWIGGKLGGGDVARILLSMPGALFAFVVLFMPNLAVHLGTASPGGWEFTLAGWLVLAALLVAVSIAVGFVMTYLSAAGVVNHHLLKQKMESKDAKN